MADIELVIKIDADDYRDLQKKDKFDTRFLNYYEKLIAHGTPLPKGHGRLIDADVLREEVNSWGMNDYEPSDFTDAIDDAPSVEAIPKADYENRLKADLKAILVELQLEIEEIEMNTNVPFGFEPVNKFYEGVSASSKIIQQKINALKENEDVKNT